jgi:predicted anti-sigma-YlaC factor YlaD
MSCESWRREISALADGEAAEVDGHLLDAHLANCPACRAFRENIHRLRRAMVGTAPEMVDLSGRVAKLVAVVDRAGRWSIARGLLAVVAVEIIVLSLPALILGEEQATSVHAARHLGAFAIAYAAGLLVVVARPARARTMLPVAGLLAGALLITGIVDIVDGHVPLGGEALHIPELVSVVLIWLLAAPARQPATGDRRTRPGRPLRLVDDAAPAEPRHESG